MASRGYGPDFGPLLQALQAYAGQETAQANSRFDAATSSVNTALTATANIRKWRQEDEEEALLKGTMLDTPQGKMSAYTLSKLGGDNVFEAIRSMVLTQSALEREKAVQKHLDYLLLSQRKALEAAPKAAQALEAADVVAQAPEVPVEEIAELDASGVPVGASPSPVPKSASAQLPLFNRYTPSGLVQFASMAEDPNALFVQETLRGFVPPEPEPEPEPEPKPGKRYARPGERIMGPHWVKMPDGQRIYNPAGTFGNAVPSDKKHLLGVPQWTL